MIQLSIPGVDIMASKDPRARSVQRNVSTADAVMTKLAQDKGKLVRWWWGVRKVNGSTGAVCYVCGETIVIAALNIGMSDEAWSAIEAHRAGHWADIKAARS